MGYVLLLAWLLALAATAMLPEDSLLGGLGHLAFIACSVVWLGLFVRFLISSSRPRSLRWALGLLGAAALLCVLFVVNHFVVPGDEERIEATIEAVATGSDPSLCETRMTEAYLEQLAGVAAPAADEVCEEEIVSGSSRQVRISEIEIDGDTATALVTSHGGSLDGSRLKLRLAREGRRWLIDRLLGFRHFDRRRFEQAYRREFQQFGSPPASTDCATERIGRLSDTQLESAVVRQGRRPFVRIFVACDRIGAERSLTRGAAADQYGLTEPAIACVERAARHRGNAALARLLEEPILYGTLVYRCGGEEILDSFERGLLFDEDVDPGTADCIMREFRAATTATQVRLSYDDAGYERLVERCPG